MPTPQRTSVDAIVRAGREILERDGFEGLTMQRVATAVGVRAPSLYKHVSGRGELVHLIANDVARELGATLDAVVGGQKPRRDIRRMVRAVRAFATSRPAAYALLFARLPDGWRADDELTAAASAGLLRAVGQLAGPDAALDAARTVVAWAHGFVSMELAGAFRLGGDVDQAFDYGVERLIKAVAASRPG